MTPILLYGVETLSTTMREEGRIQTEERNVLRAILGKIRRDRVRKERIRESIYRSKDYDQKDGCSKIEMVGTLEQDAWRKSS